MPLFICILWKFFENRQQKSKSDIRFQTKNSEDLANHSRLSTITEERQSQLLATEPIASNSEPQSELDLQPAEEPLQSSPENQVQNLSAPPLENSELSLQLEEINGLHNLRLGFYGFRENLRVIFVLF